MLKICGISDLHGNLVDTVPECDVLCIAGDISPLKFQRNMPSMISWLAKRFAKWADELPCEKVIFVAGNHDFIFQSPEYRDDAIAAATALGNVVYLENSSYEYNGMKFYGSPWVTGPANWAFYDYTQQLPMIEETMPEDTDIAIFHQPLSCGRNGTVLQIPDWMVGQTFVIDDALDMEKHLHPDFGSTALDRIVMEKKPSYVLTGHVHSGNHEWYDVADGIKVANVSLLDENYKLKYKPMLFEI